MIFKSKHQIRKLVVLFTIFIGLVLFLSIDPIYSQIDFDSFFGSTIPDGEIDGVIGDEWNDAGNYQNISLEPTGTTEIWTKNDATYLYIAIEFTADSFNPWVGIQFEETNHMTSGADGAIFGHDGIGANEYRDISFGGFGSISPDSNQDGIGAINVESSNIVTIELKKPLNSGDSAGADIDWNIDQAYSLVFIWDSNGGGSSGGINSHISSSQANRIIFINTNAIPEFSQLSVFITLIIALILVSIFIKKIDKNKKYTVTHSKT